MNIKIKTTKVRPIRRDGRGYNGTPSSGGSFSSYSISSVPSWKSITNKPFEGLKPDFSVSVDTQELQLSGNIGTDVLYHSGNANKDFIDWNAKKIVLGNSIESNIIQAKHLNGELGNIISLSNNKRVELGKSSITSGVDLYYKNSKILSTWGDSISVVGGITASEGITASSFNSKLNAEGFRQESPSDANYKCKIGSKFSWSETFSISGYQDNKILTVGSGSAITKLWNNGETYIRLDSDIANFDKPINVYSDDGIKLSGAAPFLTFWDTNNGYKLGYLRGYPDGNLHISAKQYIQLRVNDNIQIGEIRDWGTLLFDGKIHRIFDKFGMTDWDQYSASHYQSMGGLDVKLSNNTNATYIWSIRDAGDNYKAGFQISNNSNNSIFDLNQRLRLKGWNDKFIFELDKAPMMELGYNAEFFGSLKVNGGIYATSYETKRTKTTNGDLLVSDSMIIRAQTYSDPSGEINWRLRPDLDVNNRIVFSIGDTVECKIQDVIGNIRFWKGSITWVSSDGLIADIYYYDQDPTSNTIPQNGDTVVRVSGTLISLTTSDTGNPEMEFKDGDRTALLLNDKGGQKIDTDGSLKDVGGIGLGPDSEVSVSEAGVRITDNRNMTVTTPNLKVGGLNVNSAIAAESIDFTDSDPRRVSYKLSAGIAAVAQSSYSSAYSYKMVRAKTDFALLGAGNNFLTSVAFGVANLPNQSVIGDIFFLERQPLTMFRLPQGGVILTLPSAGAYRTGQIVTITGFRGDVSWVHLNTNDQIGGWKGGIFKFYDPHSTLQLMAVSNSAWAIISMVSVEFTRGSTVVAFDPDID